jgi:hypothetical protein
LAVVEFGELATVVAGTAVGEVAPHAANNIAKPNETINRLTLLPLCVSVINLLLIETNPKLIQIMSLF